jgi:Tfp pilus assembly protein PilN
MADDIITALVAQPNRIEWTSLRRRKGQIEVAEHQAQSIEAGDEAARAAALKAAIARIRGPIAVALPTDLALMRVVNVPTADIDEIHEMAGLQVDKFSPFPTEQMAVGQEILAQQERSAQVLIAACRREHVTRYGEELQAAGRLPREVDVAVLGWWRLLKQEGRVPENGLSMLLLAEERSAELIVARAGVPVVIRSLGAPSAGDPAQSAREIADEINYTLTTLEAERGAPAPSALHVWRSRNVPGAFVDELRAACDAAIESHVLETLPPLSEGLARRALERGPHLLDLAPPEWKTALAARRLQRRLATIGGAFALVWAIAVGSLAGGLQLQKKRLADARAELLALREPARAVEQLKEQVRSLERYLDPTYSALECLREISERLPEGVDLTAFTYKKYGQIALRGEADFGDPIYDFFQALEKSDLFPAVKPEGVTRQQRGERSRSQFKITIELPQEAK